MSIAASVVVKPSGLLLVLVTAVCLGAAAIGVAVGLGAVGELPLWQRAAWALLCIALASAVLTRAVRHRPTYLLDISGSGQIRLRVVGLTPQQAPAEDALVVLSPGSTIWPRFLMLRLRAEDGRMHHVPILPDCLPEQSMRAVSVACRWIAARSL